MIRRIIWSFGLSLVIGTLVGYFTSQNRYYWFAGTNGKIEITAAMFQFYENNVEKDVHPNMAEMIEGKKEFNLKNALISFNLIWGILLIISSIIKYPSQKELPNKNPLSFHEKVS